MKKFEFETSKGKFVLVDRDNEVIEELKYFCKQYILKQITEQQASEIVDSIDSQVSFKTSLNILLKSKGVYLFENPLKIGTSKQDYTHFKEAEQNTFYNPYIFKL